MSYSNQQIAKQVADLLRRNQKQYFQKGTTSSTGINKEITVRMSDGKVVRALGWNVSSPGQVNVFWDATNKRYVAWKEETNSLKRKTILVNRKTRPDEKKYLWEYFIKVLQPSSIEGFDADVALDLTGYEPVGITNTGSGYIAVFANTPNYMIVKENGNVSFFIPTKTNYLFEAIPSYEYLGEDNLWFWQKYNSERQSETISYDGSQGKAISTKDYTISLLQPRSTPSDDNYIAPTLINTSQLPHPGVVLMSNPLVTQHSTKLKSFVDTIEETADINTTFSSSRPPGGPNTDNYSNTWNGAYLHNVVESGIKENVSTDTLICNASGTATGSLIRTFEEVEGGFYELVSGSDESSTTGSLVGTSKNGSRLECHVEAEYTKTVLPTTVSANRSESVEQLIFSPILLAKNEAIEMKMIKKEWTKYICNVSRENSSAECITDVEVVCGDNIFIGEMTLNNTKYYYNNHSEGGYQWENIFFITSPDELDPVTGGEIGNLSVRSALGSDYPFYQQITKKETRTKNSMGVTNAYEYFTQTPIVLSGEVDIFSWDGSMYNLYRGNIQESGSSMQTISLGLGREEVKKIYENISVNINEFIGKSMIPSTAKTVIVPQNAYDEWVWYQVRFNFSMCNFYKVDGTIELAIAEIPTTTTPNTLRADIYRFNTQTLKWERRPNAVSLLSQLTATSGYISYHPTPSNSRRKKRRPPRN